LAILDEQHGCTVIGPLSRPVPTGVPNSPPPWTCTVVVPAREGWLRGEGHSADEAALDAIRRAEALLRVRVT
jgi:hypothetical protein